MADPEGFLRRWSRRKQDVRQEGAGDGAPEPDTAGPMVEPPAEEAELSAPAVSQGDEEDTETLVSRLPDIDEMTDQSDFRPFMDPRIPDALRNRALRKLWRSNPVFAVLDGLNDYDEDYTDAAMVVPGLKTAYQVGRGLVRKALDQPPEADAAAEMPETASTNSAPAGAQPAEPELPPTGEAEESELSDDPATRPRNKIS
ncbi:MAG: DUF3306 domain-containing protein [Inquilinus sp.]|nr:DUF3306 domain-containing protein [Inquilinus sp.]